MQIQDARFIFAGAMGLILAGAAAGQMPGIGVVRHAPVIAGTVAGSLQQLLPEAVDFNGSARLTGDLLVRGTPAVRLNGRPVFGGVVEGTGASAPSNYQVTLNGNASLGHLVRRTDAIALAAVSAPASPSGSRTVTLTSPGEGPGSFATV